MLKHAVIFVIVVSACAKTQSDSSEPASASQEDDAINLCDAYPDCNACIAGQQQRGNSEGEAETQCGLAVTGCWATWDKPVVCGESTYDEQPSS